QLKRALEAGLTIAEIYELTGIDPWFLTQFAQLVEAERAWVGKSPEPLTAERAESAEGSGAEDAGSP
ncbi:MAG: hypothetical protein GWM90_31965, partial [Gemmatimonadetes bacterium]|nr:hypothetical protein [Gemmatimonadota bacterium]NIU80086.1 hypothetical protein [Gammaproteobacteria bacterium]NIP83595.1 hypothetical protein [Gemmatimonadota bacterium]NIQ59893.1 hypothetical protein [Gemmatimonadota bacterium]NIX48506.1 hypothetical protein [Gemmatimonadota bacterium]